MVPLGGVPVPRFLVRQRKIYENVYEFLRGMEKLSHLAGIPVIQGSSSQGYAVYKKISSCL